MPYFATLPMYDWAETRSQTEAFWSEIESELQQENIEAQLIHPQNDEDQEALWQSEKLLFAQTCWGPLNNGQSDYLDVLSQPDYSQFVGGRKAYYRSAIVALGDHAKSCEVPNAPHQSIPINTIKGRRFAYNDRDSLSGYLALTEDLLQEDADLDAITSSTIKSGSHRNSIKMIADGNADFATIDCRSWDLALQFEPAAKELQTIGWTSERLGLPYVCSKAIDEVVKRKMFQVIARLNLDVT